MRSITYVVSGISRSFAFLAAMVLSGHAAAAEESTFTQRGIQR